jgi:hypothetical protein
MVDEGKYKAESFLIQLLSHLLLYAYWKHPYYLPHWKDEIDNFRLEPTFRTLNCHIENFI